MMRIGLPNGLLTSHQLRTIGQITQKYARNLSDITTRQNIQLHWLTIGALVEITDQLTEIGPVAEGRLRRRRPQRSPAARLRE